MLEPVADGALVFPVSEGDDLSDDLVLARRAAAAMRRIVTGLAGTRADVATLDEVSTGLEGVATALAPHNARRAGADVGGPSGEARWEVHTVLGPSHPFAPPLRIVRDGDRVVGTATFGHAYEGPPMCVHGGITAAAFDVVLAGATLLDRRPTLTGTLSVRYRRPTPIDVPIHFVGWVERSEPRKVYTRAESRHGDELLAEGEGIFVVFDPGTLPGAASTPSNERP